MPPQEIGMFPINLVLVLQFIIALNSILIEELGTDDGEISHSLRAGCSITLGLLHPRIVTSFKVLCCQALRLVFHQHGRASQWFGAEGKVRRTHGLKHVIFRFLPGFFRGYSGCNFVVHGPHWTQEFPTCFPLVCVILLAMQRVWRIATSCVDIEELSSLQ